MDENKVENHISPAPVSPELVMSPIQSPHQPPQKSFPTGLFVLFSLLIILVGAAGFAFGKFRMSSQPVPSPVVIVSPSPMDLTGSWETYTDDQYGFEFKYPKTLSIYTASDSAKIKLLSFIPVCDTDKSVVCVHYSNENFPGTNFEGAGLAVNIIKDASTKESCDMFSSNEDKTTETINGVSYAVGTWGGAATGHQSADKTYRTFQGNTCFELNLRISTDSSDVNLPTGTVKTFTDANKEKVVDELLQVLSTFKFLDK